MSMYELFCVSPPRFIPRGENRLLHLTIESGIRDLVRRSSEFVLDRDGIVRRFYFIRSSLKLPYILSNSAYGKMEYGSYWVMEYHLSPRYSHDFRDMLSKEKNILRFGITSTGKTLEEYSVNIPLVPNELELEELRKFRMKERMG